jgi:hypothetical protein
MLRNQVGISNDLAGLLYTRASAEIITSRTPSAEIITSRTLLSGDNNFTFAGQLVKCHDNKVPLALSMQQYNVIFYGRLKKNIFTEMQLTFKSWSSFFYYREIINDVTECFFSTFRPRTLRTRTNSFFIWGRKFCFYAVY